MANAQPCVEKIFINLNASAFQLRQKILGENNANLQYIFQETKANVTLRGRGSGFIEQNGAESNEMLHLLIEHPALKNVIEAKNWAKNLIETIQQDLVLQTNQQTVQIQQQPPPIIQTSNQQITIPQAVLSCPPPTIIQQPTHIIQQQNFIPQHQIIPQHVPMQIIQQTPPPNAGIPIRTTAPLVQFQGQTANLQQANIHIQSANGQQILLNQAPAQQYHLQYIPTTNQITNAQQMQIQHVLQPQQQIQSIIQPGTQQFITVQGNTAFMIPPPNIIQQVPPQNINTVFNPPPTTLNHEDKNEIAKIKQEGLSDDPKNNQNIIGTRIVNNVPLNQPPPVLNCPPPQIYNNQQGQQQQIQQFILNSNGWPQQQQIHQMPISPQIQIVTQPQQIRSGNELVIQNPVQQQGHQVITTFSPQQPGQSYQQIQFHQATIAQPPPQQPQMQTIHNAPQNSQSISFQQQFEQKINSMDNQQQRLGKRKFEGEKDGETSKSFPKAGMGQNPSERPSSPKQKSRMMSTNPQGNQPPIKFNVNNSGTLGSSGENPSNRNVVNKPMFNRNINPSMSNAPPTHKTITTTAESKMNKSVKNENEQSEESGISQYALQNHQNQPSFIRGGNQNLRFQGPQNFIHQQPPPISQNSQFNGARGQIMSTSSMNMYQNVGQSQLMQPPPNTTTTATHFIHQDMNVYQQSNSFQSNNQQANVTRFNVPPQQQQHQQQHQPQQSEGNNSMIPGLGNYIQQPRFRQW